MRNLAFGRMGTILAAGCFLVFTSLLVAPTQAEAAASQPTASGSTQKAAMILTPRALASGQSARKSGKRVVRSVSTKTKVNQTAKKDAASGGTKSAAAGKATAQDGAKSVRYEPATIPASLANANAQLLDSDAQAAGITLAQATEESVDGEAARYVVAADQMNDIDRAASGLPPPRPMSVTVEPRDDTDLAQTSLIGRIFIAIGGLLTIGSAVRMFIA